MNNCCRMEQYPVTAKCTIIMDHPWHFRITSDDHPSVLDGCLTGPGDPAIAPQFPELPEVGDGEVLHKKVLPNLAATSIAEGLEMASRLF
jgi:hypothetical protein